MEFTPLRSAYRVRLPDARCGHGRRPSARVLAVAEVKHDEAA